MNQFYKSFTYTFLITIGFLLLACQQNTNTFSIDYQKYTLDNGLDVILHKDTTNPVVAVAILYHAGSSREVPEKTGFAHLFEHLLFQKSEHIGEDQFLRKIENVGGKVNGFTTKDFTAYYEVVPKNALELVLWMESDRMGYFINSISDSSFVNQKNVVLNEKRQRYDNRAYGYSWTIIDKYLFPKNHPYSWQGIGYMQDIENATLEDVRQFYNAYYNPNNATLVIAGDYPLDSVNFLVSKYFAEIAAGDEVITRNPIPGKLDSTLKIYYEDAYAKLPELKIAWPTVEEYHKDAYALDMLAKLLSDGKKTPLYRSIVKENKLSPSIVAYNLSYELAGYFIVAAHTNEGKSLQDLVEAIDSAFIKFEQEGFRKKDIDRIKARLELDYYESINTVLDKSFQLATYNIFKNDPSYISEEITQLLKVSEEDIWKVYNRYIKNKPRLISSIIPKADTHLLPDKSNTANLKLEKTEVEQQEIKPGITNIYSIKTPSKIDRSIEPPLGPVPSLKIPAIWEAELNNNLFVSGIENSELPVVEFELAIDGGFYVDDTAKTGKTYLLKDLLIQGTQQKTPEELEEAIDMLGSDLSMTTGTEEFVIHVKCLSRNFIPTLNLFTEILLEPRWDTTEFSRLKNQLINTVTRLESNANHLALRVLYNKLYGDNHIFGKRYYGTIESVQHITFEELQDIYNSYFLPNNARFHIAGNISKKEVLKALSPLEKKWKPNKLEFPNYSIPPASGKPLLFFVHRPEARQSVIYAGHMAPSGKDSMYMYLQIMNFMLGGTFNSKLNLTLREEKGFTYGAHSIFIRREAPAPFYMYTSVDSEYTNETIGLFKQIITDYQEKGLSKEELIFMKNTILRSHLRAYEDVGSQVQLLRHIAKYELPHNYLEEYDKGLLRMDIESHRNLARKYLKPDQLIFIIAGDSTSQYSKLTGTGMGMPISIK